MDWLAFSIGALVTGAILFGGHYAFLPPRQLNPPWTYVYGVVGVGVGLGVYCLLTRSWLLPLYTGAALFVIGGLVVFLCYHLDERTADRHALLDKEHENALLLSQLRPDKEG
jgi:uncharacterized membrane-anchored protein